MGEVTMPRLSDTMSEGAVGRWLKQPGDKVSVGEIIAEIETDKATMELEAYENGTLQKIIVPEGQTVEIGEVIAMIGDGPVEQAPPPAAEAPLPTNAQADAGPDAPPTEEGGAGASQRVQESQGGAQMPARDGGAAAAPPAAAGDENGRVLASPVARRIADELGIDLRQVQGSGPGGRIIKENVEEFAARRGEQPQKAPAPAEAPAPAPAPTKAPAPTPTQAKSPAPPTAPATATLTPLSRMRKAIARAMNESKPGVPHIYVTVEVNVDALIALREQIGTSGTRVSVNDLVVKASARTLVKLPALNASLVSGEDGQPTLAQHPSINVSVAVALEDGLIAPVVKDADKKSIGTISAEIRDMAGRAREGKIKQNELEGATFQVTNLGMFGVVEFGSIITVPQAASLAVGAVRKVPVVRDDQIVIGQVMNLTLSADHRIVDGAVAAQYLKDLKALLEAPMGILV
jgi:pyruvate dehydrogenase E2 component (dihydrolipoamide acetyltransferase)